MDRSSVSDDVTEAGFRFSYSSFLSYLSLAAYFLLQNEWSYLAISGPSRGFSCLIQRNLSNKMHGGERETFIFTVLSEVLIALCITGVVSMSTVRLNLLVCRCNMYEIGFIFVRVSSVFLLFDFTACCVCAVESCDQLRSTLSTNIPRTPLINDIWELFLAVMTLQYIVSIYISVQYRYIKSYRFHLNISFLIYRHVFNFALVNDLTCMRVCKWQAVLVVTW